MPDDVGCPFSAGTAPPAFPFARDRQFDLPGEYALARETCPIAPVTLWNGQRAWLLTRYEHYQKVLLDERFSGAFAREDFPPSPKRAAPSTSWSAPSSAWTTRATIISGACSPGNSRPSGCSP